MLITVFDIIRRHRKQSKLTGAREKYETAMRIRVDAEGEARFAERMAEFYEGEASVTDPNNDWWRFAELKQKAHESAELRDRMQQRAREAQEKFNARKEELNRQEHGEND